jgi:hypothetical protein
MLFLFEVKHVLKDAGSVPSILGMLANLGETIQGCFNALLDSGRLLARFQWLSHHGGCSRIEGCGRGKLLGGALVLVCSLCDGLRQ